MRFGPPAPAFLLLCPLALTLGCHRGGKGDEAGPSSAEASEICARPQVSAAAVAGEANGDGEVDIADALWLERSLFAGGAAPVCAAAVDFVADGHVDAADGAAMLRSRFTAGFPAPSLAAGLCAAAPVGVEPPCGALSLEVRAPTGAASSEEGRFEATVELHSPTLAVEGWQLGLSATGCTIMSATLEGTVGAPSSEGGMRELGFGLAETVSGGAVSAVALGWTTALTLDPGSDPTLLRVEVQAALPASGCADPCQLRVGDGLQGSGESIRSVVSVEGRAFVPEQGSATVEVCAP